METKATEVMGKRTAAGSSAALLRAAPWAVALVVCGAPLAIGGTRWDAQLALAGAALVVCALTAWARLGNRGLRLPWPLWGAVGLVLVAAIQLVPLPPSILAVLSPHAHEILDYSLTDQGLYGAGHWHALSLDPPSTWVALFHQAAFAAVALVAANISRDQRTRLERAIIYCAGFVAALGFVHWSFGLDRIYGAYDAIDVSALTGYFGTFVNNNTLAGFLVLGTLLAVGQIADPDNEAAQRWALAAAAVTGLGALLAGSRGGHVALVAGALIFAALSHAPGGDPADTTRERAKTTARVLLLLALIGGALALLLLPEWAGTPFNEPEADAKVAGWLGTGGYIKDFWGLGSGRGTFEVIYPQYQAAAMARTVSHPENIVVQFLTEWGAVLGTLALGWAVVAWVYLAGAVGRQTKPRHWAAMAALAAVGVQQLTDFGFEAAGLSFPVAAVFGLSVGRATTAHRHRNDTRREAVGIAALAGTLVLACLLAWRGPGLPLRSPDAASTAVRQAPAARVLDVARERLPDHPADYLLALNVAARLARRGAPGDLRSTLRWVNRAMSFFPKGGTAHLLAARVLARLGRADQAAIEYRLAIELQSWREAKLLEEVAARFKDSDRLLASLPDSPRAWARLGNLLLSQHRGATARALLTRLLEREPALVEGHAQLARACEQVRDDGCVRAESSWLLNNGRATTGRLLRARLAMRHGDRQTASTELNTMRGLPVSDRAFLRNAAKLYGELGDLPAARESLDALWKLVAFDDRAAATALALRGALEARAGERERALRAWLQAFHRHPRDRFAVEAARQAQALGRVDEAVGILEQAQSLAPESIPVRRLLAQLRRQAPPR